MDSTRSYVEEPAVIEDGMAGIHSGRKGGRSAGGTRRRTAEGYTRSRVLIGSPGPVPAKTTRAVEHSLRLAERWFEVILGEHRSSRLGGSAALHQGKPSETLGGWSPWRGKHSSARALLGRLQRGL